jgi:hypothetical protein
MKEYLKIALVCVATMAVVNRVSALKAITL